MAVDKRRRYPLSAGDDSVLAAAKILVEKVLAAEGIRPAEVVSVAKVLHVLAALPKITGNVRLAITVKAPIRQLNGTEILRWWDVEVNGERITVSSMGRVHTPGRGGNTFTALMWTALPEQVPALEDYQTSLWMIPGVDSFPEEVHSINLSQEPFVVEIIDEDNPWLAELDATVDDQPAPTQQAVLEDALPAATTNATVAVEQLVKTWSVKPIDENEAQLAGMINADEVNANQAGYAHGVEVCDLCGESLAAKGLFVDGQLGDQSGTANMCASCYTLGGQGIGWGIGQLFAKQPNGTWRLVAGFRGRSATGHA